MYTDLTQRRLYEGFMLNTIVFVYIVSSLVSTNPCSEENVPITISRRLTGDSIWYESEPNPCTCTNNSTYLVNERQCINDQDLINDCRFVVTPNEFRMVHRIIVSMNESNPVLQTIDTNGDHTTAIIICKEQCQHEHPGANYCHIDSLEIYRGREQTPEIGPNHGFSITNNGTIKINRNTTYSVKELQGELYRMSLSCQQIESGCLFFKIAGVAHVTHAKFHDRVSGTIETSTSESEGYENTMSTPVISKESTSPSSSMILDIATYTIVGVAGFLILLFIVVLLGTILLYGCSKDKMRKL